MSLLQACRSAASARSAARPTFTLSRRLQSNEAKTPAPTQLGSKEGEESAVAHQIPAKEVMTAEVISGAPGELRHRQVRIFQPARNTMQSGGAKGDRWRIDFDILQGAGRWENPLMGWASSADYMQGTRLSFKSKEDAVHFAEKQGWDYYVQTEPIKRILPKNYAENYVYKPSELRIMRTK